MTNEYGLDVDYFRKKMERLVRDLDRYTPDELARECARMALTAEEKVLAEPEFDQRDRSAPVFDDRAEFAAFHRRVTRKTVEAQPKNGSYNDGWTTGAQHAWFERAARAKQVINRLHHCTPCGVEQPTDRRCDVCGHIAMPGPLPVAEVSL